MSYQVVSCTNTFHLVSARHDPRHFLLSLPTLFRNFPRDHFIMYGSSLSLFSARDRLARIARYTTSMFLPLEYVILTGYRSPGAPPSPVPFKSRNYRNHVARSLSMYICRSKFERKLLMNDATPSNQLQKKKDRIGVRGSRWGGDLQDF